MPGKEPDRYRALFLERNAYFETYEQLRKAFDDKIADQVKRRRDFESSLSEEISESRHALSEVAPIASAEIADIPMRRAAYTDRMSAVMSKLALLAYIEFEEPMPFEVLKSALAAANITKIEPFAVGDTECFLVETDHFVAVSFRGTTDRGDRKTDFRIGVRRVQVDGHAQDVRVHDGFYDAFRLVEPVLRNALHRTDEAKPIYLTGHSLGGALALIASAAFSGSDHLGGRIAAVYTYGAPRVGSTGFARVVKAPHYRVVNEGDMVPQIPPSWLSGYRHTGELFLLRNGRIRVVRSRAWLSATALALWGLLSWPFSRQLLFARRHAISLYASRLDVIAQERGRWS